MKESYHSHYDANYFQKRQGNDPKRQRMFAAEQARILELVKSGKVLDVGCSTGEFLLSMDWVGEKFGMEISELARSQAEEAGISFDRDLLNSTDFFDCIIFRGTIQHIDTPFHYIKNAFRALRSGGYLVFLATPNAGSIYYRLHQTLPFIDQTPNFLIPSQKTLSNALSHIGFEVLKVHFPYWGTPYARPVSDHFKFLANLFGAGIKHAFWKNSMEVYARKGIGEGLSNKPGDH